MMLRRPLPTSCHCKLTSNRSMFSRTLGETSGAGLREIITVKVSESRRSIPTVSFESTEDETIL